jgi:antitoxin component HigA of HigAB toxin-antitoxin module
MELTKDELLKKREELKAQLQEIDQELDKELLREEVDELDEITDQLNSMFQHPTLGKHCPDEANVLYEVMQDIDRKVRDLRSDLGEDF